MSSMIKFRIWHKPTKQFVKELCFKYSNEEEWDFGGGRLAIDINGDLCYDDYGNGMKFVENDEQFSIKLSDYVIQQCIGVKDKNGQDIYEGDIVKCGEFVAIIQWNSFGFNMKQFAERGTLLKFPPNFSFAEKDYEIIGNILQRYCNK